MSRPLRYRAFICYCREDRVAAEKIHQELEHYRVPRALRRPGGVNGPLPATLAPVFRDREELSASSDIGEKLRSALARSDFLIVLCSPSSARSRWVNAEIDAFCALHEDNHRRVLAVILSGEPLPDDVGENCFPAALRRSVQTETGLMGRFPLAADFRLAHDNPKDARLRLFAALLGVEFDQLKQREQERRIRKLRLALTLAGVVVIGFGSLAGAAWWQRDLAREASNREAIAAQRAANARAEAEKLVDYMLKDLRASLEVMGKLELLEPANEKVRAYYATVAAEEMDLAMLRRQGLAFHAHAVDLRNRKRGAKTATILETAAVLRARVVALEPGNIDAWLEYAETHRMLGIQRRDDGDIQAALKEFIEARRLAKRGLTLQPRNSKAAARVASLAIDEGEALMRAGRSADAMARLTEALNELDPLSGSALGDLETKDRAAAAAWQLGNLHRRAGHIEKAEAVYRRGFSLTEQLCAAYPDNVFYLRRRQQAAGSLGQLYLESDRFDEAVRQLQLTQVWAREILMIDPANLVYQDLVATNLVNLAEAELRLEKITEADQALRESITMREQAIKSGATDVRTRNILAHTLGAWSYVAAKQGNFAEAISRARRAEKEVSSLAAEKPTDIRLADDHAYQQARLAGVLLDASNFAEAVLEYRKAIAQLDAVMEKEADSAQLPRWRSRADWYLGFGMALQQSGQPAAAVAAFSASLDAFDRIERAGPLSSRAEASRRRVKSLLASIDMEAALK